MLFVLVLFLFLCLKFLKIEKNGILKNKNKFNLSKNKKKFSSKKLNLKYKFLFFENASLKQIQIADQILNKIKTNVPKICYNKCTDQNPVFIHDYPQKTINIVKKYCNFDDFNKKNISKNLLESLLPFDTNFDVGQNLNLPKQKITIFGNFKKFTFDFKTYKLNIYKNKSVEIAHYNFEKNDFIKIILYNPTRLQLIYFDSLSQFEGMPISTEIQENFAIIKSFKTKKYFMFSCKPTFFHFSKNTATYSKHSCLIAYFDLFLTSSIDLQLCFSDKLEKFYNLDFLKNCVQYSNTDIQSILYPISKT